MFWVSDVAMASVPPVGVDLRRGINGQKSFFRILKEGGVSRYSRVALNAYCSVSAMLTNAYLDRTLHNLLGGNRLLLRARFDSGAFYHY